MKYALDKVIVQTTMENSFASNYNDKWTCILHITVGQL